MLLLGIKECISEMDDIRMKLSKIKISGYKSYGAIYSDDIFL